MATTLGKAGDESSVVMRKVEVRTVCLSMGPETTTTSGSCGVRFSVRLRCYLTCAVVCPAAGTGSSGRQPRVTHSHMSEGAVATFRADELATDAACRGAIHAVLMQVPRLEELGFGGEDAERTVPSDLAPELAAAVRAHGGGDNDYTFAPAVALYRLDVYSDPKALVMACKKMAAATAKKEDQGCGLDEEKAAAMCPICLDALCKEGLGSAVEFPGCSHAFHGQCLTNWFHRKITCPLCRANVIDKIISAAM